MSDADRLFNVKGHETFGYGQGSYDGDACRQCQWQGGTNTGKAHERETRREVFDALLAAHDTALREQIAQAILNNCDSTYGRPCRPCRQAASLARTTEPTP